MTQRSRNTPQFLIVSAVITAYQLTINGATAFVVPSPITRVQQPALHKQWPPSSRAPSQSSKSFTKPAKSTTLHGLFDDDDDEDQNNPNAIPPELRDDIYAAEANTPAAQGRLARILFYILATVFGVTIAFANAFLSDLRFGDGSPSSDLGYYGFGWVESNWVTGFFLMNKIGGGLGLLGAGLCGTLAEVEFRSKKENAEKIWAEMQRRKELKENPSSRYLTNPSNKKKRKNNNSNNSSQSTSKKEMTGKQKKRISALEELMTMEEEEGNTSATSVETQVVSGTKDAVAVTTSAEASSNENATQDDGDGGIFGKIKGFYEKADSMAASQALLLNKELEDRGIVDKITDETGLKVIGKEAAESLKQGTKKYNSSDEKKKAD